MTATAEEFLRVALDTGDGGAGKEIAVAQANGALEALAADLNARLGGAQLFGGTRTGAPHFASYSGDPPSPAKAAVDAAFRGFLRFGTDDRAVAAITPGRA